MNLKSKRNLKKFLNNLHEQSDEFIVRYLTKLAIDNKPYFKGDMVIVYAIISRTHLFDIITLNNLNDDLYVLNGHMFYFGSENVTGKCYTSTMDSYLKCSFLVKLNVE